MRSNNLILIGFMGSGKSTVGAICAERLGFAFRDTDALIVEQAGQTIAEIFAAEGEEGFRARERAVIELLASGANQVIATGGGAVMDPSNARALKAAGRLAELRAAPETILRRVGPTGSRPLLSSAGSASERIKSLLEERTPTYAAHAHGCFDTEERSPREVADAVVDWFQEGGRSVHRIDVQIPGRSYPILIADGLVTAGMGARLIVETAPCHRICIVSHPALVAGYASPLQEALRREGIETALVAIPPGERYKNLRAVERLYDAFLAARLDRRGVVVALGGGVLGDTVGFAAATYLRGVRVIQAPTTLLSQVDSSVGGKTGVDLTAGKNLVGAFHQPSMVLVDPVTLGTLPTRELRSGLAEVIKYGIIYDPGFFADIGRAMPALLRRDNAALASAIARSCEIKAEVVAQDETEQGLRAILNFGHTVGHGLESITRYRRYKHGEAISIGMVTACLVGEQLGVTPPEVTAAVCATLAAARLPTAFPGDIDSGAVLDAAQRDKKTEAGRLRFVLVRSAGDAYVQGDVPGQAVARAIARHKCGEFLHG